MNLERRKSDFLVFMAQQGSETREIAEKYGQYLEEMGFFTAPASRNYHGDYEGGLFDHSFKVAQRLVELTADLKLHWDMHRSPVIVGMFHDLCKCDEYRKTADGYEHVKNTLLTGHGEKSVMLLSNILQLTKEEVACIRYHMGAYVQNDWTGFDIAIRQYPTVLFTHTADMIASKIDNV